MQEKRENNMRHQDYLKHQVALKNLKADRIKQEEYKVTAMLQDSLKGEHEKFQQYASVCIDEWEKQKKTTAPMTLYMTKANTETIEPAI